MLAWILSSLRPPFIVSKTSILPKGVTAQAAFDVAQDIIQAIPTLAHLSGDVLLASFCPEGFVGIGVPIGTDAFVQNFVAKSCRAIIDDVEKLDSNEDGFIHYQFLRFCQATRLQYINSHICSVILAFCNSSMLIAKLLTRS